MDACLIGYELENCIYVFPEMNPSFTLKESMKRSVADRFADRPQLTPEEFLMEKINQALSKVTLGT
jgi:hypothetical protein